MHRRRPSGKNSRLRVSTSNPRRAVFVSDLQTRTASTQNAPHFGERASGGSFDAETGLTQNYFRDYDSGTGRFVQSDPLGLAGGSWSTYSYAGSNPLSNIDPLGLATAAPNSWDRGGGGGGGGEAIPLFLYGIYNAIVNPKSDKELQKEIEREANRREYKNICDQQPPPDLVDPCERAKWELNKAKACKAAREENTRRWWGGVDNRHSPQLFDDLERQIQNAERAVERLCKCK